MKLSKQHSFVYGVGIVILTLGITLTIQSQFGTSPFDALLVGLSETVGLTVGSWEIILALMMIFCNALLSKRRPQFLGFITAFLTGVGIDLWLFLIGDFVNPDTWFSQLMTLLFGLIFSGLGTAFYLYAKFAPAPVDELMLVIRELTKISVLYSRTIQYAVFLVLAYLFNGPIGIGTIITLCFGGPILNYCMNLVERRMVTKIPVS